MQYKGYVGSVEFSEADGLFFGKVLGIRALISYEGTNAAELVADFHGAVDDYLSLCEAENSEPEKIRMCVQIFTAWELHCISLPQVGCRRKSLKAKSFITRKKKA